MTGAEFNLS